MSNRWKIFLLFISIALCSIKLKAGNSDKAFIFYDSAKTIRINGEKYFDIFERLSYKLKDEFEAMAALQHH